MENIDKDEIIDELEFKNKVLMIILILMMLVIFIFCLSRYLEPMCCGCD